MNWKNNYHRMSGVLAVMALFVGSCASKKPFTMMPAPVLYKKTDLDPFAHLGASHRTTSSKVFYATNRAQAGFGDKLSYGNQVDHNMNLGIAHVRMGKLGESWKDLKAASLGMEEGPDRQIPLTLQSVEAFASLPVKAPISSAELPPDVKAFTNAINDELAMALDPEIMIYVHGTKVDFANSVFLTAEVDYFAGRDYVGVGFAWPSHQNIFKYVIGTDVRRALNSSGQLKQLITLLSQHTKATKINILAYSAGGKVASKALFELRQEHAVLDAKALKKKFRLGTLVFAAIDVEIDIFLDRAEPISELADQVLLTVSDDDNALRSAKKTMGGNTRVGAEAALTEEEEYITRNHLDNIEIINVSEGKEKRGFDIVGHHYWYRHPWISSDIIFSMRTGLAPHQRGLSEAEMSGVWFLSPDYPERVSRAAKAALKGQW